MCGIAGIFDISSRGNVDEALLQRMNDAQLHRGPDDGGIHVEPGVGLAHRRLSIIDLAGGHQPLYNEDGSVVVVYNGEIYNFQELADELVAHGHTFGTRSDTEVIVHAWEEWGEECVSRFRGMFAFALWDRNREVLFLARDRLGIKPLYYAQLPGGQLIFASELKALLIHPEMPRRVDPRAVEDYFAYGYIPDPKTIFQHAHKLAPGYILVIKRGSTSYAPHQYWDVPFGECIASDNDAIAEELISRLREAVRIRLIADVPLGAFLSGGVDSSAVVAMMAGLSDAPVNTCSISFNDLAFDEAEYAEIVAKRYATRHLVEQVTTDDFELVDRLANIYDEPFADSSAIPTFRVCGLARKQVTVALSGDGGDETLAGYQRYHWFMREEKARELVPHGLRSTLFAALGTAYPKINWAPRILRAKAMFQALALDSVAAYFDIMCVLKNDLRSRLFSPGFRRELQGYQAQEVLREHDKSAPRTDPLARIQYLDMKTYLPGDILTKVDRASMAHALEVRVPILDHELVEFMAGIPSQLKLYGDDGKHILKKALLPYLPHDIIYRRKQGFAVPLASWFRGPLREQVREALLGPQLMNTGIFDHSFVERLINEHQSEQQDHSAALWSLLMFESFQRQVLMQ